MTQIDAFCTNGASPPVPASDFVMENHGSIFLLQPLTPTAQTWIDQHLPPDALRFGSAVVVEPRYVGDIIAGIGGAGLVAEISAPSTSWSSRAASPNAR